MDFFSQARVTGWPRHHLHHKQIICILLQSDNPASSSSLNLYRLVALPDAQITSGEGNRMLICWFLNTSVKLQGRMWTSLNKIVAVYPQPLAQCKHKPIRNCRPINYLRVCI